MYRIKLKNGLEIIISDVNFLDIQFNYLQKLINKKDKNSIVKFLSSIFFDNIHEKIELFNRYSSVIWEAIGVCYGKNIYNN